jgi:hypothetical protein
MSERTAEQWKLLRNFDPEAWALAVQQDELERAGTAAQTAAPEPAKPQPAGLTRADVDRVAIAHCNLLLKTIAKEVKTELARRDDTIKELTARLEKLESAIISKADAGAVGRIDAELRAAISNVRRNMEAKNYGIQ